MLTLNEYLEKYKKPNAETVNAEINDVLTVVFSEIPELSFIWLRGYTPSWNDGEPCKHRMHIATNLSDPDWLIRDDEGRRHQMKDLPEGFMDSCKADDFVYLTRKRPEIEKVHRLLHNMSGLIQAVYNTNFDVVYTRKDRGNTPAYVCREYDCGY